MAAISTTTIRTYGDLAELVAHAAELHAADTVAAGAPVLGRLDFGVVAVDATGRATLCDVVARGSDTVAVY